MKKIVDAITAKLDLEGSSVDVLREIHKLIPTNISLTTLDYDAPKNLTLKCVGDSLPGVLKFVSNGKQRHQNPGHNAPLYGRGL